MPEKQPTLEEALAALAVERRAHELTRGLLAQTIQQLAGATLSAEQSVEALRTAVESAEAQRDAHEITEDMNHG